MSSLSKPHFSVRGWFNLGLLALWTLAILGFVITARTQLRLFLAAGLIMGAAAGLLQRRALLMQPDVFRNARTARDVKNAFKLTTPGRSYLTLFR
jgi:hypothetical protein